MAIDTSISAQSIQTGLLNAQAEQLLSRAKSSLSAPTSTSASTSTSTSTSTPTPTSTSTSTSTSKEDAKIEKAGKDFESILLGSWLTQAEQSFAKVPGGDGEEDDDSSKDQFQGIAMQALAGSLTASGGIGIAKMITQHLRSQSNGVRQAPASNEPIPAHRSL